MPNTLTGRLAAVPSRLSDMWGLVDSWLGAGCSVRQTRRVGLEWQQGEWGNSDGLPDGSGCVGVVALSLKIVSQSLVFLTKSLVFRLDLESIRGCGLSRLPAWRRSRTRAHRLTHSPATTSRVRQRRSRCQQGRHIWVNTAELTCS